MSDKKQVSKNTKDIIYLVILLLVIFIAFLRYKTRTYEETRSRILMSTIVEISLKTSDQNINKIIDSSFAFIADFERKISYYDSTSTVWEINHSPQDSFYIDTDLHNLLRMSSLFYDLSHNKFDITVAPLLDLWFDGDNTVPDYNAIEEAQRNIGFYRLKFGHNYLLRPPGVKLNFGGLAKGYLIDLVVEHILSSTTHDISGYINAGGDMRVFRNNKPMKIGIKHPRESGQLINMIEVMDRAVVTSGDYERFFDYEGRRYHHIIDPFSGYPTENIYSVTVISETAFLADVLSTVLFLMDPIEGIDLIKEFPETDAIIYYREKENVISLKTEGIRDILIR